MSQHLNVDFKIRLPAELKEKIRNSATAHNRTMTADIVARLEQSFIPHLDDFPATFDFVGELDERVKKLERDMDTTMEHVGLIEPDPPD